MVSLRRGPITPFALYAARQFVREDRACELYRLLVCIADLFLHRTDPTLLERLSDLLALRMSPGQWHPHDGAMMRRASAGTAAAAAAAASADSPLVPRSCLAGRDDGVASSAAAVVGSIVDGASSSGAAAGVIRRDHRAPDCIERHGTTGRGGPTCDVDHIFHHLQALCECSDYFSSDWNRSAEFVRVNIDFHLFVQEWIGEFEAIAASVATPAKQPSRLSSTPGSPIAAMSTDGSGDLDRDVGSAAISSRKLPMYFSADSQSAAAVEGGAQVGVEGDSSDGMPLVGTKEPSFFQRSESAWSHSAVRGYSQADVERWLRRRGIAHPMRAVQAAAAAATAAVNSPQLLGAKRARPSGDEGVPQFPSTCSAVPASPTATIPHPPDVLVCYVHVEYSSMSVDVLLSVVAKLEEAVRPHMPSVPPPWDDVASAAIDATTACGDTTMTVGRLSQTNDASATSVASRRKPCHISHLDVVVLNGVVESALVRALDVASFPDLVIVAAPSVGSPPRPPSDDVVGSGNDCEVFHFPVHSYSLTSLEVVRDWVLGGGKQPIPADHRTIKNVWAHVRMKTLERRLKYARMRDLHSAVVMLKQLKCTPVKTEDGSYVCLAPTSTAAATLPDATTTPPPMPGNGSSSSSASSLFMSERQNTDDPPVFIFLGGGMASGKTTAVRALSQTAWWRDHSAHAVVVDADEFKRHDPLFELQGGGGSTSGMGGGTSATPSAGAAGGVSSSNTSAAGGRSASATATAAIPLSSDLHEKSVKSAEQLLLLAVNFGRDVVFDGTMMWAPFVRQTIDMVRHAHLFRYTAGRGYRPDLGVEEYWVKGAPWAEGGDDGAAALWPSCGPRQPYLVKVIGIHVQPEIAVPRAILRQITTGRGVPVQAQLRSFRLFATHFEEYAALSDECVLFNNNVWIDLDKGETPIVTAFKPIRASASASVRSGEAGSNKAAEHWSVIPAAALQAATEAAATHHPAPVTPSGLIVLEEEAFNHFLQHRRIRDAATGASDLYMPEAVVDDGGCP